MNLVTASRQWATRPADERFWTLKDLHAACIAERKASVEKISEVSRFHVEPNGEDLVIVGKTGGQATFTNFSFGQLCRLAAPTDTDAFGNERKAKTAPDYLTRLPASIAAAAINYDLEQSKVETKALWNVDRIAKTVQARAFTTPKYGRIWNDQVIDRLLRLEELGWRVPPARPANNDPRARPATEADCLQNRMEGLGVKPGDLIAPAGLYKGEKDLFCFLVNESRPIDAGGGKCLYRGFFAGNSEVGDQSYWITEFFYNAVCGNHIVWDAQDVKTTRVVHIGSNAASRAWAESEKAWNRIRVEITEYANDSVNEVEAKIKAARVLEFGKDKNEVVDFVYGKRIQVLSRDMLEKAYDLAEAHPEDSGNCPPTTKWGFVQGLTRLSQTAGFADKRVEIDKAAGKVLELVPA